MIRSSILMFSCLLLVATCAAEDASARDITINDLLTIEDIETVNISPDGQWIAFQTLTRKPETNSFRLAWYITPVKGGAKPELVATGGGPEMGVVGQSVGSTIVWAPDNRTIYFTKKMDDAIEIWKGARGGAAATQLTKSAGNVMNFTLSADGKSIFFKMDRTRSERRRLEEKANNEGHLQQYLPTYTVARGAWIQSCTDGDPGRFALGNAKFACTQTAWTYDLASGQTRQGSDADMKAAADASTNSSFKDQVRQGSALGGVNRMMTTPAPDGGGAAWIQNVDPKQATGTYPMMVLRASIDGKEVRCTFAQCQGVRTLGFRRLWWLGKEIVFQVADGPDNSVSSFYAWNPRTAALRTILRSDDTFGGCERAGAGLICGQESWTLPKRIVSVDLKAGAIAPIADVNPGFKDIGFTRVEKMIIHDDKGRNFAAHLVYPKDYRPGQRYPVIVTTYHSSGFLRGATGDEQPIHAYAANGLAVLSVNFNAARRGDGGLPSDEYNSAYMKDMYVEQQPARAIERAVDQLVERGFADPDRIGITGLSQGSVIAGTAILRRNYGAASVSGLGDIPRHASGPPEDIAENNYNNAFGSVLTEEGRKTRAQYSTSAHADRIDTPILIQVPDDEFDRSSYTYHTFLWAGKPVELYQYPHETHVKAQPIHKYWVYSRNLDWFKFWLLGQEDSDPSKVEQYKRWNLFKSNK